MPRRITDHYERRYAGMNDLVKTAQQPVAFEDTEVDTWFERSMPNNETQKLFNLAWWRSHDWRCGSLPAPPWKL